MAGKEFPLTIQLRTEDRATARIRRVNERIRNLSEPVRRVGRRMGRLGRAAKLPQLARGFGVVTRNVKRLALGLAGVVAAAGLSARALKGHFDELDNLAKTADRVGVTVDALAQLRFAAKQSGLEATQLDSSMEKLSKRLGEARAGTGRLVTLLKKTNPELLKQLKATDSNEEAVLLLADAFEELEDPQEKSALAAAAFSNAGIKMINMLDQGRGGIEELMREHFKLAGSQEDAARGAEKVGDASGRLGAAFSGVKSRIAQALTPAVLELSEKLKTFFMDNRERIAEWARDFGEKLPGRIKRLIEVFREIFKVVRKVAGVIGDVVGALGGAGNAVKVFVGAWAGFKGAQLAASIGGITSKVGLLGGALAAAALGGFHLGRRLDKIFGLSDKISNLARGRREKARENTGFIRDRAKDLGFGQGFKGAAIRAMGVRNRGVARDVTGLARSAREAGLVGEGGKIDREKVLAAAEGDVRTGERVANARALERAIRFALEKEGEARQRLTQEAPETKAKVDINVNGPPGTRAEIDRESSSELVDLFLGQQAEPAT